MSESARTTAYAIEPVFTERWSPRAFSGASIQTSELYALFEAARGRRRPITPSLGALCLPATARHIGINSWRC